jgi:hypothetical protein
MSRQRRKTFMATDGDAYVNLALAILARAKEDDLILARKGYPNSVPMWEEFKETLHYQRKNHDVYDLAEWVKEYLSEEREPIDRQIEQML